MGRGNLNLRIDCSLMRELGAMAAISLEDGEGRRIRVALTGQLALLGTQLSTKYIEKCTVI